MGVDEIVRCVYLIQGASDPNHGDADIKERMEEIFRLASYVMRKTAYQPED